MSSLQSGIVIADRRISGTLNYVTGYTGFSGDEMLQSGHYLALRVDTNDEDDEITVELLGGITGHPVTLDSDRNIVLRITNPATQKVRIVVKHIEEDTSITTETMSFRLNGLTLESAS